MSNIQQVVEFRRNRKDLLVKLKGGRCCICGFSAFNEALEFHHVNSDLKKYAISNGDCHGLKSDIEEISKCALLCANCHRGVHAKILSIPENWDYLDQKLAQEELSKLTKKKNYCKFCGKEISSDANYCKVCAYKKARKVQRPSRKELKDLIKTTSFVKIGQLYSVSDNSIRKWCKNYNLPSKKSEILKISDEEWEQI